MTAAPTISRAPATVRVLDPDSDADRAALLALTARCDTGTDRFRVDRAPDPFALGRYFGPTTTWGAFLAGRLVGSAAISTQRRLLRGQDVGVDYLHDLRVDPSCRRAGVTTGIGEAVAAHRRRPDAPAHAIGTVLGDNPLQDVIMRGTARWLGPATRLGRTAHVVAPPTATETAALPLGRAEWRAERAALGAGAGLLPSPDACPERLDDLHLAWIVGDRVAAVARLTDEEGRRRLLANGRPLRLGYLALMAPADPPQAAIHAFIAAARGRYDLVAYGLDAEVAAARGVRPTLTSTTWAFGADPGEPLGAHELTLI